MGEATTPPKTELEPLPGLWTPPADLDPRPPFQSRGGTFLWMTGRPDPAAVTALVPDGLNVPATGRFIMSFFHGPEGWVLAPWSGFFAGFEVEGFDASDGSPAEYQVAGVYSGRAAEILRRNLGPINASGDVKLQIAGDAILGIAPLGDGGQLTVRARLGSEPPVRLSGMTNFIEPGHDGELVLHTSSYSHWATQAAEVEIDVTLPPDHRLAFLNTFRPEWTYWMSDSAFTMGTPSPLHLGRAEDDARLAFLDVLARLGRPVGIVEQTGRIVYLNTEAEALLRGDAQSPPATRLPAGTLAVPQRVRATAGEPTLVTLASGQELAARAFPIALRLGSGPLSMVLLTDPRAPGPTDPEPLLRLMGLTPTEAALAALVGTGLAPAQAAQRRGVTVATARSMLKVVFAKLGVSRQAELAVLVSRLQTA